MCTVAGEAFPLLPQRRPPGGLVARPLTEPLAGEGGDPPALPDLDVLRQVLAGLRRLA